MVKRELQARFQGSLLGVFWLIAQPLTMLCIYTFVFSVVLRIRWGGHEGAHGISAMYLFAGMMIMNLFTEVISKAPNLIIQNPNLVKKVLFPLEILVANSLLVGLFTFLINFVLLLCFSYFIEIEFSKTILFFPILVLPLFFFTLGLSWLLSSLGVYIRDLGQLTPIFTQILFFACPVIYPISAVPEEYRPILLANPLSWLIESFRGIMFKAQLPNLQVYSIILGSSIIIAFLGFIWFQKTRKGFADVL